MEKVKVAHIRQDREIHNLGAMISQIKLELKIALDCAKFYGCVDLEDFEAIRKIARDIENKNRVRMSRF